MTTDQQISERARQIASSMVKIMPAGQDENGAPRFNVYMAVGGFTAVAGEGLGAEVAEDRAAALERVARNAITAALAEQRGEGALPEQALTHLRNYERLLLDSAGLGDKTGRDVSATKFELSMLRSLLESNPTGAHAGEGDHVGGANKKVDDHRVNNTRDCRACGGQNLKPMMNSGTGEKWVHCDDCGNRSQPTTSDPLAQWNCEQRQAAQQHEAEHNGDGGHVSSSNCQKHDVPLWTTMTDDHICPVCVKVERDAARQERDEARRDTQSLRDTLVQSIAEIRGTPPDERLEMTDEDLVDEIANMHGNYERLAEQLREKEQEVERLRSRGEDLHIRAAEAEVDRDRLQAEVEGLREALRKIAYSPGTDMPSQQNLSFRLTAKNALEPTSRRASDGFRPKLDR